MFEKEAEDNKPPYAYCSFNTNCELWKDGFQKGAEFGYNKAMDEQSYRIEAMYEELQELKSLVNKYRQAVDKCLHITFMGGGCEVHTIGQYATLVDGYLTDVEGLAKWKD